MDFGALIYSFALQINCKNIYKDTHLMEIMGLLIVSYNSHTPVYL